VYLAQQVNINLFLHILALAVQAVPVGLMLLPLAPLLACHVQLGLMLRVLGQALAPLAVLANTLIALGPVLVLHVVRENTLLVVAQLHHLYALIVLPTLTPLMMLLHLVPIVLMVRHVPLVVPRVVLHLQPNLQYTFLLLRNLLYTLLLLRILPPRYHQQRCPQLRPQDVMLANSNHVQVVHVKIAQQASTSLTQTTVVLVVMIVRQVRTQATRAPVTALLALQEQVRQTLVELNVLLVPPESTVILPVRLVAHFVRLANIHQIVAPLRHLLALIVLPILILLMMLLRRALIAQLDSRRLLGLLRAQE
jgi:hypothetical protein